MTLNLLSNKTENTSQAFTLMELLVVIAVIGLLSSIIFAITSGTGEQGRIAKGLYFSQHLHNSLGSWAAGTWSFDENPASHGTIISDLSGWSNNGILYTNDGTANKSVSGVVNNALSLDGVDDYVNAGNPASLQIADTVAIESWVYMIAHGGTIMSWFNNGYTQAGSIFIGSHVALPSNWWAMLGGTVEWTFGTKISNKWVHLVITLDLNLENNQLKAYQNGVLVKQTNWTSDIMTRSATRYIGGGGTGNTWNGQMDEVRIYGQALTSAQVKERYYAGLDKLLTNGLIAEQEYQQRLLAVSL